MSLEAEHLDDDTFKQDEEEFSYASKNLGEKLQKDIEEAKDRELQRHDIAIGKTKAREKRMEATSELAKYYVGDVAIPVEMLYPPTQETAYRGYSEDHAKFCAANMQTSGVAYPLKPAVVCVFEVILT